MYNYYGSRYNWNVPPTGITSFYLWDYTSPAVREFWATSLATLYVRLSLLGPAACCEHWMSVCIA